MQGLILAARLCPRPTTAARAAGKVAEEVVGAGPGRGPPSNRSRPRFALTSRTRGHLGHHGGLPTRVESHTDHGRWIHASGPDGGAAPVACSRWYRPIRRRAGSRTRADSSARRRARGVDGRGYGWSTRPADPCPVAGDSFAVAEPTLGTWPRPRTEER